MNIFAIGGDPKTGKIDWKESGRLHDNKRVVKMFTETCQILCTALRQLGVGNVPYKSFNPKHPCNLWATESYTNCVNLLTLAESLNITYYKRYENKEKYIGRLRLLYKISSLVYDNRELFATPLSTPLQLAMPDEFKTENPVLSYRKFFASKDKVEYDVEDIPIWFIKMRKKSFTIRLKSDSGEKVYIDV